MSRIIDTDKKEVAIMTGSSSGIGHETALLLARNGFDAFATMRNMNKSKEITDVAKKESLMESMSYELKHFGKSKILRAAMEVDEQYKRFRAKLEKGVRSAIREGVGIPKSR